MVAWLGRVRVAEEIAEMVASVSERRGSGEFYPQIDRDDSVLLFCSNDDGKVGQFGVLRLEMSG